MWRRFGFQPSLKCSCKDLPSIVLALEKQITCKENAVYFICAASIQGEGMPYSKQKPSPSLLIVGDLGGKIERQLQADAPTDRRWTTRTCPTPAEAADIAPQEAPDLAVIVCKQIGDELCADLIRLLEHAKLHWPFTFFILASERPIQRVDVLLERFGEMPVVDLGDLASVSRTVEREMLSSIFGVVRGVSLSGFLQMMEWEEKSLCIRAESGRTWGRLHLLQGRLVQAYSHATGQTGEDAALDILSWDSVSLRIERSYHNRSGGGTARPLTSLLMEAMQRKDEDARQPAPDPPEEDQLFRRPRSSTAGLKQPQPEAAALPTPALLPSPAFAETDFIFPDPPETGAAGPAAPAQFPALLPPTLTQEQRTNIMANVKETLNSATNDIDGAMAAALVDYESGMALGTMGSGVNLDVAAAGNTEVVRAKLRTMKSLGIDGEIEDILITLQNQYHIIYMVPGQTLFLYLVLAKDKANLAMARYKLKALGKDITIS